MKKLIAIGKILRPWGNKGAVKVTLFSGKVECLESFTNIYIGETEESVSSVSLEKERKGKESILVTFLEIHSIGDAEALRGKYLYVQADELLPPAEDEYYIDDLIGLSVIHMEDGKELGCVVNILETSGTDLLEVQKGKRILLVPLTKAICKTIDIRNKTLVIDPPEGLLDVNEV